VTKGRSDASAYVLVEQAVYGRLPQLRGLVFTRAGDFAGLNIRQRGAGDWIAVAKRYGDDGGPQVLFATGFDFVGLLLNLEGSLAADRWREDKPWTPGG
jgi:hypothetical protein